jgi:hypothetical protein
MGSSFLRYIVASNGCRLIPVVVLLALTAAGCNDTCFSFVSNPPQVQFGVQHPCKEEQATGTVSLRIGAAACAACADSGVQHIYVVVESVDLQPAQQSGNEELQWERVSSRTGPVQVDLLARPINACAGPSLEGAARAGVYRAIRLRLLSSSLEPPAVRLAQNACGDAGYHCMVMRDGRIVPLAPEEALEMSIALENTEPGLLFVLPGAHAEATLHFSPEHTPLAPGDKGLRIWPALRAVRGAACAASGAPAR